MTSEKRSAWGLGWFRCPSSNPGNVIVVGTQTSDFVQVLFVKLMGFNSKHENVRFELATSTLAVTNLGFELATSTRAITNLGSELATSAFKNATQPTTATLPLLLERVSNHLARERPLRLACGHGHILPFLKGAACMPKAQNYTAPIVELQSKI